jgi:hypothetical protein
MVRAQLPRAMKTRHKQHRSSSTVHSNRSLRAPFALAHSAGLLALLLGAAACDMEEPPDAAETAWALDHRELAPDAQGQRTLARFDVPTEDGSEHYTFTFSTVDDGALAILIDTPIGYPRPLIDDECALDTFLRVAPPDHSVPAELLAECGAEPGAEEASPHALVRAGDLALAEHTLRLERSPPTRRCSLSSPQKVAAELEALAEYQAPMPQCEWGCDARVEWNTFGCPHDPVTCYCKLLDGDGNFISSCNATGAASYYGAAWGNLCVEPTVSCYAVPNPECKPESWVYSDSNYSVWQRTGTNITRVRVEIENCGSRSTEGWWRTRPSSSSPWSSSVAYTGAANADQTLILSAGWDAQDRWRGWDFQIRAESEKLNIASAWVRMTGKDRHACSLML